MVFSPAMSAVLALSLAFSSLQTSFAQTTTVSTSSAVTPTFPPGSTATPNSGVNYWFSFGDSYTQTQFANNGTLPSPDNPMGNPPFPGFTAVGGVNWIDQATFVSNHSLVLTYNYAFGGATINASLVTPFEPQVLSLIDQVNEFLAQPDIGNGKKVWTSKNALASIFLGTNDVSGSFAANPDYLPFANLLMDDYFEQVENLFDAGLRNFLFLNAPAVDRTPLIIAEGSNATTQARNAVNIYNSVLSQRMESFKATHDGVRTFLFDADAVFNTILDNLPAFNFTTNQTAFGDPGDFWGNNFHPSSQAQVIFGNIVGFETLKGTVW